eukprot:CAMPEP_0172564282 /NCGR_PEP_ID=MMETSP1067-20121228/103824_1 /TAXON_ID=265564 ORGANISM="Thalassiosira punctigera, Strain Tpunct2005C2" /NCGR_SAMPLE_ID=MMETSP1067 /ASSEMBLY_ACC=CAM_ASM_000444 /LENGTH=126 /DNA_ID=CAMNT_0013354913 /DNA_START=17 /DNA_END=397 /DNA_ORIENTATION=+
MEPIMVGKNTSVKECITVVVVSETGATKRMRPWKNACPSSTKRIGNINWSLDVRLVSMKGSSRNPVSSIKTWFPKPKCSQLIGNLSPLRQENTHQTLCQEIEHEIDTDWVPPSVMTAFRIGRAAWQ